MIEKKGRFITFEGIDGCGKTTQIRLLKERILEETGEVCYNTLEPSAGPVGSLIRQFLSGRIKTDEKVLASLFASDRLDHLLNETDGIRKKLEEGTHVLCDRYVLSNYAYQGMSTSLEWVKALNSAAEEIVKPDCHIFIDLDPEIALKRMKADRVRQDLYETMDHLTKVRASYLSLIRTLAETEPIRIINGNQSIEKIEDDIWHQVANLFI